ncbi:MAG: type II toxin-antitoxin system HicA family toxin [Thermaceae bacterium]|nr:type II toxin-antitoxin system HicA family toxin [Thermaceae bacterium]
MNAAHRKTLEAIFTLPVPRNLEWRRIETLLVNIGCEVIEGSGARVAFKYKGIRADFHRPHPQKEAKPYQVKDAGEFLESIGVKP